MKVTDLHSTYSSSIKVNSPIFKSSTFKAFWSCGRYDRMTFLPLFFFKEVVRNLQGNWKPRMSEVFLELP